MESFGTSACRSSSVLLEFHYQCYLLLQKTGSLPDNKVIASELSKKPELKKYMKRVMPFAQTTREKIDSVGVKALNLTLEFDEMEVLSKSIVYLESTLDVCVKPL